jgi:MFS family permease
MVEAPRPMSIRELYVSSPLGAVGCFVLGMIFACMFGMTSVYGTEKGLTTGEISTLVGAIYLGGLLLQFPLGWISDRVDRRRLIAATTAVSALSAMSMLAAGESFALLLAAAFFLGGTANPLYSLFLAHTNDFLEVDQMPAAASGLVLLTGAGAAGTPVVVGFLMDAFGPAAFPTFMGTVMAAVTAYALYRMTVRPSTPVDETLPYTPVTPAASAVTVEAAQSYYAEQAEQAAEEADEEAGADDRTREEAPS